MHNGQTLTETTFTMALGETKMQAFRNATLYIHPIINKGSMVCIINQLPLHLTSHNTNSLLGLSRISINLSASSRLRKRLVLGMIYIVRKT